MTRVHLVRHGRAAAGWDADPDPPLDEVGRRQAMATASDLAPVGPLAVVSSPLRRCRETAALVAAPWSTVVTIDEAVREIPSPDGVPLGERVPWLRAAMGGTWAELGERYTSFRDEVVAGVCRLARGEPAGLVVASHFIAINAVIGAAVGDDRLVIRSLDNASVTVVDVDGDVVRLVEAGREADTLIR